MADFWDELKKDLQASWLELRLGWLQAWAGLRNALRRARGERVDYVVLRLSGPCRNAPAAARLLPAPAAAAGAAQPAGAERALQAIADAENVRGVVFVLGQLSPGGWRPQNVRRSLERLRAAGKEAVVFTPYLDLTHYYVASAAGRIVAPPAVSLSCWACAWRRFSSGRPCSRSGWKRTSCRFRPTRPRAICSTRPR